MTARRGLTAAPRALLVALLALTAALLALTAALLLAGPAFGAAPEQPWLRLTGGSIPGVLQPGGGEQWVTASAANLGDATLQASVAHPVVITDTLPAGWTLQGELPGWTKWPVTGQQGSSCPVATVNDHLVVTCTITESLDAFERFEVQTGVNIPGGEPVGSYSSEVTVTGGENLTKKTAPLHATINVGDSATPFGVEAFEAEPENDEGGPETQAGAHPFQFTTYLPLNTTRTTYLKEGTPHAITVTPEPVKDLRVNLPAGLIGNTRAVPQCTDAEFTTINEKGLASECPPETAIGAAQAYVFEPILVGPYGISTPVFNLVPAKGEPARFGFLADGVPVVLDTVVDGGDYHVVVNIDNVPEALPVLSSLVTIWGNPGDKRHDSSRGTDCLARGSAEEGLHVVCKQPPIRATEAYLTLPTSCGPLESNVEALSWTTGATFLKPFDATSPVTLTGCEKLPFTPQMSITPDKPEETTTNSPLGLKVVLKAPQTTTLEENGLAEADLRNSTVTLPAGIQLSPSAANGLASCSESAVGFEKENPQSHTLEFAPEEAKEESEAEQTQREEAGTLCPKASKVGTVRIKTPVLAQELHGNVYLSEQEHNPFGSLFGFYIVVKDVKTGVVVKLAGKVEPDPETGQITTVFENAPQDPFEEFEFEVFNGPRASVASPAACGTYTTSASFTPWSGTATVGSFGSESELQLPFTSGPGGTPCASTQPFAPAFVAGTTNNQAGALTGFTLNITRPGEDQALKEITMTLPPGFAGYLSHVEQCPEPQASQGTCGPNSLIGSATAVAGLGSDPFTETGGQVYITGPYGKAPFGLSVVIPAKAGPFNFGNVVTRSEININSTTAQLSISSPLPTMLNTTTGPGGGPGLKTGAPVQLRQVEVNINRPNFQFNPTNCSPLSITGTLTGEHGATAPVSEPFQAQNCQALPFNPTLEVEAGSKYTKLDGTNLSVRVTSGPGQANIAKTKLTFPLQLPSRLTTLQKACLAATFHTNPALCSPESIIGTAVANTPVLNNPLTGPAYLVSYGGAKFPDVEFVLQGEGITLVLDGSTNIHNGITSSSFESVPDAPVSTFTVTLPAGPKSAFTGYESLCKPTTAVTKTEIVTKKVGKKTVKVKKNVTVNVAAPLVLPTILTGQNGDVITEETPLKVTGCQAVASFKSAKAKPLTRAQKLKAALKACKKKKNRAACEKQAYKKYGPLKKKKG